MTQGIVVINLSYALFTLFLSFPINLEINQGQYRPVTCVHKDCTVK